MTKKDFVYLGLMALTALVCFCHGFFSGVNRSRRVYEALLEIEKLVEQLRLAEGESDRDSLARAKADFLRQRLDLARAEYERALGASPESAFLYRELGLVERQQSNVAGALARFRRRIVPRTAPPRAAPRSQSQGRRLGCPWRPC